MKNEAIKPPADDQSLDSKLRPSRWDEYVGQEKAKTNIRLIVQAAGKRGESCDHILLYGQAGLGKTTLAHLIAKEAGGEMKTTTGPALEKAGDVAAILSNLEPFDILFVDEAHRINKLVEEILYPALESRKLHFVVGKGPSARTFSLDLPPFTVIAATTKVNLLSSPLRSRFGATVKLEYYGDNDIEKIIERSAKILEMKISKEAVATLARASRKTPRTANRLLKRARDYTDVYENGAVSENTVRETLKLLDIDNLGLEKADRDMLKAIILQHGGGPVGVKTLSASLAEDEGTIEDVYEPFLMSIGLIERTPAGRTATEKAYVHLGIELKNKKGLI
ncbi:Holliday junction DNA helicase RuvB [Candidatus Jorgensenbacteria bacterium RIFCSPLOWO2_02_FULL_45_12]|uniref:Holliday junction branch migration complex subunit RuvB n=2 Tax=Parcubacteria group TaxID=1794811 RepID=A0A0G1U4E3_9BACT|nr:MAG: Holliday junction ATP-dependent DNA helicase RuvB [Candidatus Wolfebacteria bacterium GW2011_GWA2_47_9b]OGG38539.1 MAG: Holliday junction DNA helicase RuvB [Candidatus Jorgensenbacteria bacterium RIFCSPHIGHO2_02_FULL_45_20]OGG42358.1 MAG: Holliday junction DNA helicase RuvB [Candidatus Jorgensenbacteria bacterium RIFCSPLOWO2_02_FULL_45_12]